MKCIMCSLGEMVTLTDENDKIVCACPICGALIRIAGTGDIILETRCIIDHTDANVFNENMADRAV